jgi:hypothetical protein
MAKPSAATSFVALLLRSSRARSSGGWSARLISSVGVPGGYQRESRPTRSASPHPPGSADTRQIDTWNDTRADVYHLSPAPRRIDPTGWTALEHVLPDGHRAVVLAYRLARSSTDTTLRLGRLDARAKCDVTVDGKRLSPATGADLATGGLRVRLPAIWRAAVIELTARQ